MAAVSRISKQADDRAAQKRARLRRMKVVAGGLLAVMAGLFITSLILPRHWPESAAIAGFIQAFAEAAMVGAIADWFAVTALFRHPLGLPIPHTAIIARNKDRIGESLGNFICNNFLAPDVVSARLESWNAAAHLARWLKRPDTAARVAKRANHLIAALAAGLDDPAIRAQLAEATARGLGAVPSAPLAGRLLALMTAQGRHMALFDRGLALADSLMREHQDQIRAQVGERSWKWLPRWVDEKLADKLVDAAHAILTELHAPDHPWRQAYHLYCQNLAVRLVQDPALAASADAWKQDMLATPEAQACLEFLWREVAGRLQNGLSGDHSTLTAAIERSTAALADRMEGDTTLQVRINTWVRRGAERAIVPYRNEIGTFIAQVVARWDTATVVEKLELQVGKDLQYIRINGTVVGGLVGLIIHTATLWLG